VPSTQILAHLDFLPMKVSYRFASFKAVLDTILSSYETALYSVYFHNSQRRTTSSRGKAWALPFPVEAETKLVTNPNPGKRSFSLPSTMESVSEIEAAAEKLAAEAGIDEDERFRITMAIREAAVNAVLHGNDYDPAKQVTASFENNGKSLIFTIADQGKGVDWEHLPDPLAPENLLRGTGRGIFLIRSFMDEVHFRQLQPGTELTLIKHLTPAPEQT
jgi:serine/threonine-protein kinase RsbW